MTYMPPIKDDILVTNNMQIITMLPRRLSVDFDRLDVFAFTDATFLGWEWTIS
jgi:hypothetical protein